MAVIKKNELKEMETEALKKKLDEITFELNTQKGAITAARRPKNVKYRELRRLRARIMTLLHQRAKLKA